MAERTISAAWLKGVAETLKENGLDASCLFAQVGLDLTEVQHQEQRFASEKINALWELAALRSGNPAISLAMSLTGKPVGFDAIAYLMMSCPDLLSGLQHLSRYQRIVSDAANLRLSEEQNGYSVSVDLCCGNSPVPRQRAEFALITILNLCRWTTGQNLQPLVTEFTGPAPADLKPYQDAFQSALRFDAPAHRLVFACADCLSPLQTSNPLLAQLHERFANEKLNRLGHTKVSCRARDLIVRHLSGGEPLRRDIASALCMSERTLQRRLQAEKTSFQDLVDTTRKELAKQYLRQRDLTLTQNAALLGFADPSTFFRSCRRWFGMSPHEYRTVAYKTWDARIQGGLEA